MDSGAVHCESRLPTPRLPLWPRRLSGVFFLKVMCGALDRPRPLQYEEHYVCAIARSAWIGRKRRRILASQFSDVLTSPDSSFSTGEGTGGERPGPHQNYGVEGDLHGCLAEFVAGCWQSCGSKCDDERHFSNRRFYIFYNTYLSGLDVPSCTRQVVALIEF